MSNFAEFGLSKPILSALAEAGYEAPTEIQSRTINVILSGADLFASAQTGSGKTAAFALPIINNLQNSGKRPRALVLAPTRELALQVASQFKFFSSYNGLRVVTLYGGVGMGQQMKALRNPVDVVVATPGRLIDCLDRNYLTLDNIKVVVLDEADRLLDLGFTPQLRRINTKLPKERQTLMFSATIDANVTSIAEEFTVNPVTVKVQGKTVEAESIEQQFMHVSERGKEKLLVRLIKEMQCSSILVFTQTKHKASYVRDRLRENDIAAEEIHGDISQMQREHTLRSYRNGEFDVLVATDVAARGLDIPAISHVINYDLPDRANDYVHRIGRTGRAGRAGTAVSFICEGQRHLLYDIEKLVGRKLADEPPARDPNDSKMGGKSGQKHRVRPGRPFKPMKPAVQSAEEWRSSPGGSGKPFSKQNKNRRGQAAGKPAGGKQSFGKRSSGKPRAGRSR